MAGDLSLASTLQSRSNHSVNHKVLAKLFDELLDPIEKIVTESLEQTENLMEHVDSVKYMTKHIENLLNDRTDYEKIYKRHVKKILRKTEEKN